VLTLVGAGLAFLLGLLIVLLGGVMAAFDANSGASAALTGGLAMVFGLTAIPVAALFFLPRVLPAVAFLALEIAALLWAFARVDSVALALVPVLPLAFAALSGVAALGEREQAP